MKVLKNKALRILILFMMVMLLVPTTVSAAPKISKKSITINVKKKYTLKVTGTKKKVVWKSNNKNVASVSSKGVVTGKKAGKATISAKIGEKTLKCVVTVKKLSSGSGNKSGNKGSSGYVWLSATGSQYHSYNHCGRMNPSKARKVTLAYAKSHGYGKCRNCW